MWLRDHNSYQTCKRACNAYNHSFSHSIYSNQSMQTMHCSYISNSLYRLHIDNGFKSYKLYLFFIIWTSSCVHLILNLIQKLPLSTDARRNANSPVVLFFQ
eukprot:416298_1